MPRYPSLLSASEQGPHPVLRSENRDYHVCPAPQFFGRIIHFSIPKKWIIIHFLEMKLPSIEQYYQILDYNKPVWDLVRTYVHAREQLHAIDFLSARISCLVGEKGVGKTVLACQKALALANNDPAKVFYISLDDTLFAAERMYDLAHLAQENGIDVVVFDEVHRYSDWKVDLKRIADRLSIRCIISGSSILSFKDLGGLSRRMVMYQLQGMTLREYLNIAYNLQLVPVGLDDILSADRSKLREIKSLIEAATERPLTRIFEEYVRRGYYAYGVPRISDTEFSAMLRQATEDTIAYEIVLAQTHSRPDMARKLQAIFKAIAQNVPYTIDYEALKGYAHISDIRTLKHYLACLQDAGIIRTLDRQSLKSLRKPEKLYLGNSALYYAYADLRPNSGSIRETFFLTSMALAGHDVRAHERHADFALGPYTFEVGGPNKSKRQIKGETQAFIVNDTAEPSADPKTVPLWAFGMLAPA